MTYQQLCALITEAANAVRDGLAFPGEDRHVLDIERAHRRDDIGCLELEDIEVLEDVACRGCATFKKDVTNVTKRQ